MKEITLSAFSDEAGNSLSEQITALKENGISYTELRSIDGKNISAFIESESKNCSKILSSEGIKVWAIGSPLGKVDINVNFSEYLNTVKRVCETANIFGTDRIRVFSFFNAYDQKEKVFEYLSRMVETAKSYNVKLCHENEKEIYGDVKERVAEISENVKGLYNVYDPANFIQVGEKADDTLALLHSKSDYFHIKDVIESTGELVPAGYGDGKIKELIGMIDGKKTLTVEPHLALFDAYSKIDNSEMRLKFKFKNNREAFDRAVDELKKCLSVCGYKCENGKYIKD